MADRNNRNQVKEGLQSGGQRPKNEGRMTNLRVWSMFYIANAWPKCDHVSTKIICMRVGRVQSSTLNIANHLFSNNFFAWTSLGRYPMF